MLISVAGAMIDVNPFAIHVRRRISLIGLGGLSVADESPPCHADRPALYQYPNSSPESGP